MASRLRLSWRRVLILSEYSRYTHGASSSPLPLSVPTLRSPVFHVFGNRLGKRGRLGISCLTGRMKGEEEELSSSGKLTDGMRMVMVRIHFEWLYRPLIKFIHQEAGDLLLRPLPRMFGPECVACFYTRTSPFAGW